MVIWIVCAILVYRAAYAGRSYWVIVAVAIVGAALSVAVRAALEPLRERYYSVEGALAAFAMTAPIALVLLSGLYLIGRRRPSAAERQRAEREQGLPTLSARGSPIDGLTMKREPRSKTK